MVGLCSQIHAHNKNLEKTEEEPVPAFIPEERNEKREKMMEGL